jgi:outer membrane protein TolC
LTLPSKPAAAGLCLLLLALAPALQAAPGSTTLGEILDAAMRRTPGVEVPDALRAEGEARRDQADSLFAADPALVLRHQTDAIGDGNGLREWEAGLEAPLWLPGQKADRRREAGGLLDQANAYEALRRLTVAGELRERLWELLIARETETHAEQSLDGARALQRAVARRVEAGELARAELNLVLKETLAREAELMQAQNALALAIEHYRRYVGTDELPAQPREPLPASEALDDRHPKLMMAEVLVQRARAARDRTRGERHGNPSLYIGGLQTRDASTTPYQSSVDLQLRVPLGLASQARPALAGAERALTEALADLARTRLELVEELHHREAAMQAAQDQLRLAGRRDALAAEGLRLAQRAFELGEGDLFKLLAARQQAVEASRLRAVSELELGQAIARFNQAAGVVPQ